MRFSFLLVGLLVISLAACNKGSGGTQEDYSRYFGQTVTSDCDADFDASIEPWPPASNTPVKISTGGILDDGCKSSDTQTVVFQVSSSGGVSEWKPMRQQPYTDDPDLFEFVANEALPKGSVTLRFKVAGYLPQTWTSDGWTIDVQ